MLLSLGPLRPTPTSPDGGDVDAAMQTYVDPVGGIIDQCLAELNQ